METFVDVGLSADGDWPIQASLITGLDLIAQRISVKLQIWVGEVLQDKDAGMPFLRWLEAKPPPLSAISAKVRSTILSVPGVLEISRLDISHNEASLTVAIEVGVVCDEGELTVLVQDPSGVATNQFPQWVRVVRSGSILP